MPRKKATPSNSKERWTIGGTKVILERKIGKDVYLCTAITRKNGVFLTQVDTNELI
jgi:hypothetical protein